MGSLDTNPDPKILEPNHETGSNKSEPLKDTPTTSNENDLFELVSTTGDAGDNDKKTLPIGSPSSSTSSTNSISKDSSQDSDTKNGGKVKEGIDHTSETPPIQVMERPSTPKYRIPSSVFARKQSGNQDWAMASNESLFSIQMSFNYQDSFNWQSGDLERYAQEVGPIPETDETHGSNTGKTHGSNEESIPKKHKKPNLHEKQGRKPGVDPRVSAESESAKSFTFPVLTEETDKGGGGSLEAISEKEHDEPEKQKAEKPPPTWTNCFGCCTFCC